MDVVTLCVTFISSLLGIAWPVTLDIISRLDDRYSSNVTELFLSERQSRLFLVMLPLSLVFLLLWMLAIPPLFDIDGFEYLVGNSAQLLVQLSSVVLVVSFFIYVKLGLVYYVPTRFVNHLIQLHDKAVAS